MNDVRPCVPEWCESGGEPHNQVCDNAPMEAMTKREFVGSMHAAAEQAIGAYQFLLGEGFEADAKEMALAEVEESAICFAGIGSCGRGWCKHS